MKISDVQFLQCPTCCSDLALYPIQMEGERVVSGVLSCVGCTISFPIMNEVCHFLSKEESAALLSPNEREAAEALLQGAKQDIQNHSGKQQLQVGANWDYQFSDAFKVRQQDLAREDGFWGSRAFHLFSGLSPDDLRDKDVAIFCGGSGREAWHVLNSGASTVVVLDLGGHINTLPKLFQQKMKDVLLLRCNVSISALKQGSVDLALCDHALQHVDNHRAAYANMAKCLKPKGIFSICVYSYENNWPMTHAVEPAKLFLKSLPLPLIKALATIPAVLLYALDAVYRVLTIFRVNPEKLPFRELLSLWRKDGIGKFWEACFDLMHAPISHHFRREEVESLARENFMEIVSLHMVNKTMWTMLAKR